jgi:hypothetical protein
MAESVGKSHFRKAEMGQSDREYLLARAVRERTLALEASVDVARDIHLILAHEYETRASVRGLSAPNDNDVLGVRLVTQ